MFSLKTRERNASTKIPLFTHGGNLKTPTFWGKLPQLSPSSPWVTLHQANVVSWDVGPLSSPWRLKLET